MSPRRLIIAGVAAIAALAPLMAPRTAAQVKQGERINEAERLVDGAEGHATVDKRLLEMKPDPVNHPAPRNKWDGKPDLSGVYWPSTYLPTPDAKRQGQSLYHSLYRPEVWAARQTIDQADSPGMHCWPESPITGAMHPTFHVQMVSAPGFVAMINTYGANYRIIPTDGRPHDPTATPTFQGDSVGHWEGDTLVVDVTNFKPRYRVSHQFFDTSSDALHIVERWTRPDARFMEYEATVDDPKTLTGTFTTTKVRRGMVSYDIAQEAFCIQDDWLVTINEEQSAASKASRQSPK